MEWAQPQLIDFVALPPKAGLMSLYKLTVKSTATVGGVHLEKGMTAEAICRSDPIGVDGGKTVQEAFQRKYGIDLKKAGAISHGYLLVEKIN